MANWSQHHDLVYAFVCVSFLADGEVDESEKEAMRGNVKVMLPDVSDEEYNAMEAEVINKFIELGDVEARMAHYGTCLEALKGLFTTDEDRFKVVKNLAYIARADDFIHENEVTLIQHAIKAWNLDVSIEKPKSGEKLKIQK